MISPVLYGECEKSLLGLMMKELNYNVLKLNLEFATDKAKSTRNLKLKMFEIRYIWLITQPSTSTRLDSVLAMFSSAVPRDMLGASLQHPPSKPERMLGL